MFFFKSMYLGPVPTIIIVTFVQGFLVYRTLLQALSTSLTSFQSTLSFKNGGRGGKGECSLHQDQRSSLSLKSQA